MWEMTDSLKLGSLLGHELGNPIHSRLMATILGPEAGVDARERGFSEVRRWKDGIANVILPGRPSTFSTNYRGQKRKMPPTEVFTPEALFPWGNPGGGVILKH